MEHITFRSTGESVQIGKSPEPFIIIWDNGSDLRLLEHELGNEDSVGIARPTPGKIAPVGAIPAQERTSESAGVFFEIKICCKRSTLNVQRSTLNSEDY